MKLKKTDAGVRYPEKRSVNLAQHEPRTKSVLTLVLGALAIAALCACVAKFGVLDQLARADRAESDYRSVHAQYEQMQQALADYPRVEEEYRTYSRKWMQDGSAGLDYTVDRRDALDLLEKDLMPYGTVKNVIIQGDRMMVSMSGMNLGQISVMTERLRNESIVEDALLTIATTEKDTRDSELDFSITVLLRQPEEEAAS